MSRRILFLDIDGCLSDGKYQRFDLQGLQRLEKLVLADHLQTEVVLCTGRSHSYIEALAQVVQLGRYAITDHGATIFDYLNDDVFFAPQMTTKIQENIAQLNRFFLQHQDDYSIHWRVCHGKTASLSLAAEKGQDAFAIRDFVAPYFQDSDDFQLLCSGRALDIVPTGINKWTGAQFFLQNMKRTPEKIAAIGDSHGDLPILKEVDFAACPANADPDVKAICDYISPEKAVLGVCDIFLRFFTKNEKSAF